MLLFLVTTLSLLGPFALLYWTRVNSTIKNSNDHECKIPTLSPRTRLQKDILPNAPKCFNSTALLFRIDFENNLVRLEPDQKYWSNNLWNTSKCFYKHLVRIPNKPDLGGDNVIIEIKNGTTALPNNIDHVHVWCSYNENQKMFYEDYLSAVQLKPHVEEELDSIKAGDEFYSLMILGQDSTSHANFIRTMPKVQDFLVNTLGAVEFHGLNAIGPSTFWNIFPLISGLSKENFQEVCFGGTSKLDRCPFIWKLFEKQGYRTAFTEDFCKDARSMFLHLGPPAFSRELFHYDFRFVNRKRNSMQSSEDFCFGSQLSITVLLEHMIKVALAVPDKPYWAFMWAQSLSHFDNMLSTYGEPSMLSSLEFLHEKQLLNNTILILLSDHGFWWRDFKKSKEQAFMEQRLPMLYIVLPKKFQEKYSLASKHLRENSRKLITVFDVHETMKDLLNLKDLRDERLMLRQKEGFFSTNKSLSLFLPVNPNRICAMAGISLINCACIPRYSTSVSDPGVIHAAGEVLKKINGKIRKYPQCSELALVNITEVYATSSRISLDSEESLEHPLVNVNRYTRDALERTRGEYFEMVIETTPGGGKFYVAVGVHGYDGRVTLDGIVRLNEQGFFSNILGYLNKIRDRHFKNRDHRP
ncbi:unnamed protein product [Allacma fusca]|uniref:Uncharacterized protein n=1 Tax=Allacma fusca TaxID=39272 RepID=A0A8J2LN73_9HEXA|nr:unnamed protein product [Allacma fusca]